MVHAPGSKNIVMTDHCLGVCCEDLCKFLYKTKRSGLSKNTQDRFTTMWKELTYGREHFIDLCDKRRKEKGNNITNARYLMINVLVDEPRNLTVRVHNLIWISYYSIDERKGFEPNPSVNGSWELEMKAVIKKKNVRVYDQGLLTDVIIPCGYWIK